MYLEPGEERASQYFQTLNLSSFIVKGESVEEFRPNRESSILVSRLSRYIWNDFIRHTQNVVTLKSNMFEKLLNYSTNWFTHKDPEHSNKPASLCQSITAADENFRERGENHCPQT